MKARKVIFWLVVLFLVAVVVGSGIMAYLSYIGEDFAVGEFKVSYDGLVGKKIIEIENKSEDVGDEVLKKMKEKDENDGFVNCGENMKCFFELAENCEQGSVSYTTYVDFFGMNITQGLIYEIKELNGGEECIVKVKIEEYSLVYSEFIIESQKEQNYSLEEIKKSESDLNEKLSGAVGRLGLCYFDDLSEMGEIFLKMHDGTFEGGTECTENQKGDFECESTGDWENVRCEGEAFEPIRFD